MLLGAIFTVRLKIKYQDKLLQCIHYSKITEVNSALLMCFTLAQKNIIHTVKPLQ